MRAALSTGQIVITPPLGLSQWFHAGKQRPFQAVRRCGSLLIVILGLAGISSARDDHSKGSR
jgi:hypothetical protein